MYFNMSLNFILIGGSGFVGRQIAAHLRGLYPDCRVVNADLRAPVLPTPAEFVRWDVREPIPDSLLAERPDWIFNLAAIHREPGHASEEYFDTNHQGAQRACELAERTGCTRIFFTSSIAVYGPTRGATREDTPKYPTTPYGISKLLAERTHQEWQASAPGRRLVVCRPGVIYGAGETGNIPRLLRAVKKGFFLFPGKRGILKSYAYSEGLLESIDFVCGFGTGPQGGVPARFTYNYVETPTEPLGTLTRQIAEHLGVRHRALSVPIWMLVPVAALVQLATRGKSGIHPLRVRKAATPTHIVPQALMDLGFEFRYPFRKSLTHWQQVAPQDF